MPAGKRLGRHTDTAEETQYILSGAGELLLDDGPKPVRAGDVFVLKQGTAHDLRNTGSELLRIIAFFSAPQVQQHWTSEVWEPGALEITGTPNS
jgi:quercetin dioxygenase-like cupin family protein